MRAEQELVAAGDEDVALRDRDLQHAERMRDVERQRHARRMQPGRESRHVDAEAVPEADMADRGEPGARVDGAEDGLFGRFARLDRDDAELDAEALDRPAGQHDGGEFVGEHDEIVAVAPVERADRGGERRAHRAEEGDVVAVLHAEMAAEGLAGGGMRCFERVAARQSGGLGLGIAAIGVERRARDRRLAAGEQVMDAVGKQERSAVDRSRGRSHFRALCRGCS